MINEQSDKRPRVTPQGAVEVDERDLDQATGGMSSGGDRPTESLSLNFTTVELSGQKVAPQTLVGAGPGAGPHVVPEKKI